MRESDVITASLIGLGNVGLLYDIENEKFIASQTMTHARALFELKRFQLNKVVDLSMERRMLAKKLLGSKVIAWPTTVDADLESTLTVIAVNTTSHLEVVRSLQEPPKILVLEKPAGSNSQECLSIMAWSQANNVEVYINYFRRYLSVTSKAEKFLRNLDLGKFLSAEIEAYGNLVNIHSHFIDLAHFLTNRRIFCECRKSVFIRSGNEWSGMCNFCQTSFNIKGINSAKRPISMRLEFENVTIEVTNDGMQIAILERESQKNSTFQITQVEFFNYQKTVYQKILSFFDDSSCSNRYVGFDSSIHVHKFIESLADKNE